MYLPYSQQFEAGYLAAGLPRFRDFFDENHIALPLAAGDAVFFYPALHHGAEIYPAPQAFATAGSRR